MCVRAGVQGEDKRSKKPKTSDPEAYCLLPLLPAWRTDSHRKANWASRARGGTNCTDEADK